MQDLCVLPGGGWGFVGAVKTLQSLDTPQLWVGTMWAEAGAQRHVKRMEGRKPWCTHSTWLEWDRLQHPGLGSEEQDTGSPVGVPRQSPG